ncbi:hypothetical protein CWI42_080460 [Ordospora colligata]|nr:hypothetical protein CWI42_080460 [Ordospora colligata]
MYILVGRCGIEEDSRIRTSIIDKIKDENIKQTIRNVWLPKFQDTLKELNELTFATGDASIDLNEKMYFELLLEISDRDAAFFKHAGNLLSIVNCMAEPKGKDIAESVVENMVRSMKRLLIAYSVEDNNAMKTSAVRIGINKRDKEATMREVKCVAKILYLSADKNGVSNETKESVNEDIKKFISCYEKLIQNNIQESKLSINIANDRMKSTEANNEIVNSSVAGIMMNEDRNIVTDKKDTMMNDLYSLVGMMLLMIIIVGAIGLSKLNIIEI